MHKVRWFIFSLAILLQPLSAVYAQSAAELLIPVDEATLSSLASASKYELRSQAYFAKRYRIVQINYAVLREGNAEFNISAFPDLTLRVRATDTHGPSSSEQLQEWTGELVSPAARMIIVETGEEAPAPRVHLWVRSGAHEVPLRVVRDIAKSGSVSSFGPVPNSAPVDEAHLVTKIDLQSLSGEWFVPRLMNSIVIQPLDGDPRYHIIFEKDRAKIAQDAHGSEDSKRKLQQREQFMQALERERTAERAHTSQR